jgi:hypothetical protein
MNDQEEKGTFQVVYHTEQYADGPVSWEARQQKEVAA